MTFAQEFKKARLDNNLSQGDISKHLKLTTPQFISSWERGISYPPKEKLKAVCKKWGFNYELLSNLVVNEKIEGIKTHWGK